MILFPAVIVNHVQGIFVILSLLCVIIATDTNGLTFQFLDKEKTILQLTCDGRGVAGNGANLSIAIYNVTCMKTLAQMTVGQCPWTEDNGVTGQVYSVVCLQPNPDPLPVLKIIVTDVDKSSAPKFGCNITDVAKTSNMRVVTRTITANRNEPTVATGHRAAESRLKPMDTANQTPETSFSVYAMAFAILSLTLGLAAALFYIGLQKLRSRRNTGNVSGDSRTARSDGNTDAIEEVVGDSGPDSGGERTLMCPNGTFRRPSYQDYTEPMSPTPSTVSDYAGMEFLQIQLSDTLITAPNLRLPRNNFTKKSVKSSRVPFDKISEYFRQETVGNSTYCKTRDIVQGRKEVKNGCRRCLESAIVVVEYATTEILECSDDDVLSYLRSYI